MSRKDMFGPALKLERTERGLTQEALARAAGLHRTEISLLERSLRMPLLETIVVVCRVLEMAPAQLLSKLQ